MFEAAAFRVWCTWVLCLLPRGSREGNAVRARCATRDPSAAALGGRVAMGWGGRRAAWRLALLCPGLCTPVPIWRLSSPALWGQHRRQTVHKQMFDIDLNYQWNCRTSLHMQTSMCICGALC